MIDANIFLEVELGQKKGEPSRKLLMKIFSLRPWAEDSNR